jgi:hypothetical protein
VNARRVAVIVAATASATLLTAAGSVRPDAPPVAHTGGFGEPTCRACHADGAPLGAPDGTFALAGLPARYEPGRTYEIEVALDRPGMERAGFELAVRHAPHTPTAALQAGSLTAVDTARVALTRDTMTGVVYAHHVRAGTAVAPGGRTRWVVRWTAPPGGEAAVIHAAAVAANDDNSSFGDEVYARALVVPGPP